jgi:peroxiredoxin
MENNMQKNGEIEVNRWVDERLAALNPEGDWQPNAIRGLARLREQRVIAERGRRWAWAAVAAAVACLGLIALPAPRMAAERAWQNFSTPPPKMAPDFTLNDASGNPVKLSGFRGKVVLLNFWATWCGGCKVEIPWFIEFQQTYGERDFVVLGVSLDDDGWRSVKPYIDAKNINYRVMLGNGDIAARYGFQSLPTTLIIDKSGRIASAHVGLAHKSDYKNEIEMLLNKN